MAAPSIPQLDAFSLQVSIWIAPANVPAFLEAFQPVFEKVAAEPECVYFEVFQDPEDEGHLSWVENWNMSTQIFFEKQFTKEYYKEYLEITRPMFVKEQAFVFLKRVRGLGFVKEENWGGP